MKVKKSPTVSTLEFIFVNVAGDVVYWPVWWYSRGLFKAGRFCLNEVTAQAERLGLPVWVKNIFTPMFGQYDWEGRLISFAMRLIQIIVRGIALAVWTIVMLAVFLIWIILPPLIIYEIIVNFLALAT